MYSTEVTEGFRVLTYSKVAFPVKIMWLDGEFSDIVLKVII